MTALTNDEVRALERSVRRHLTQQLAAYHTTSDRVCMLQVARTQLEQVFRSMPVPAGLALDEFSYRQALLDCLSAVVDEICEEVRNVPHGGFQWAEANLPPGTTRSVRRAAAA
jgi:hypothetical protein